MSCESQKKVHPQKIAKETSWLARYATATPFSNPRTALSHALPTPVVAKQHICRGYCKDEQAISFFVGSSLVRNAEIQRQLPGELGCRVGGSGACLKESGVAAEHLGYSSTGSQSERKCCCQGTSLAVLPRSCLPFRPAFLLTEIWGTAECRGSRHARHVVWEGEGDARRALAQHLVDKGTAAWADAEGEKKRNEPGPIASEIAFRLRPRTDCSRRKIKVEFRVEKGVFGGA